MNGNVQLNHGSVIGEDDSLSVKVLADQSNTSSLKYHIVFLSQSHVLFSKPFLITECSNNR
jgi:hypothetical protein